ncbi:hypothetical protein [Nonomuraea sp. NPDC005692]|uniref:hypothetical protein n=1 Tax=Nonomuraea sp. NPDC005692 TaxID=3157168 RepID=UPI0033F143B7
MSDARGQGYKAVFSGLRQRSAQADSSADALWDLRTALGTVFYREGNPLGDDQYGIELEKNRYRIEDGIFTAFDAYIQAVEDVRDGLRDNARNYEDAEGYGDPGGEDYRYPDPDGGNAGYPPLDGQVPPPADAPPGGVPPQTDVPPPADAPRGDMPPPGDDPSMPMPPGV